MGEGVHCNKELNLKVAEPRFESMPFCLQSPVRVPSKVAGCGGHTSSLPHLKSADRQEMKQPEEQDGCGGLQVQVCVPMLPSCGCALSLPCSQAGLAQWAAFPAFQGKLGPQAGQVDPIILCFHITNQPVSLSSFPTTLTTCPRRVQLLPWESSGLLEVLDLTLLRASVIFPSTLSPLRSHGPSF